MVERTTRNPCGTFDPSVLYTEGNVGIVADLFTLQKTSIRLEHDDQRAIHHAHGPNRDSIIRAGDRQSCSQTIHLYAAVLRIRLLNTHTATAMGSSGNAYPRMKSDGESGEANRRIKNEVLRSLAISIPEKRERNDSPKTAIPGVMLWISNRLTGMLA